MTNHRSNIGIVSALIASCLALVSSPQRADAADGPLSASSKFAFGPGKVPAGYTQVLPDMTYSKERGFGFEPGADLKTSSADAARGSITSDKPFFFSVALPEGNYRVTATFGDAGVRSLPNGGGSPQTTLRCRAAAANDRACPDRTRQI